MKKLLLTTALLAGCSLGLENSAFAHGGQYRGPGDTVPPGGGGSGGGGPSSPGPAGPSSPGGAGPATPGPGGPGNPGGSPSNPVTGGGGAPEADLTAWTFWWEFNKEPYLNLKSHIHSGGTQTGSDGFFLGHGQQSQSKDSLAPTEEQIRQKVVPALLSALETETNNDIVTGCMIALAKIGDAADESGESKFAGVFEKRLSDSNQEISETAAVALGILANDKSVELLNSILADTPAARSKYFGGKNVNFRTRSFAAYGLGLIGKRTGSEPTRMTIVQDLTAAIAADDTKSRDLKVACIVSLGLVPLDTVDAPAQEPEKGKEKKDQVVDAHLSRINELQYLYDFLQDDSYNYLVRAHCPTAMVRLLDGLPADKLAEWKGKIADDLLHRASKSSKDQKEIQESAVLALGLLGNNSEEKVDKEIRKALGDVPKDLADQQSRNFAMIALAKAGGELGEGDPADGIKDASSALLTQLSKGAQTLKPWAGIGMGVMGRMLLDKSAAPETVAALGSALRSTMEDEKNPARIGAYAIGLGILKDADSADPLRKELEKLSDEEARGYVSVALGLINDRDAVKPIQDIIAESKYKPDLLKQAAIALGLLGDKHLVDTLITMLREAKSLATQAALSSALGFIGDQRSIDPLVEMLQNKELTESARGFAAVALGIVADKEPFPWNTKIAVDLNYRASTETLNDQTGTGILNIL